MKSLLITREFSPFPGGVSTTHYNICKNLPMEEIVVLAPKVDGYKEFDERQRFKIYRREYFWHVKIPQPVKQLLRLILFIFSAFKIVKTEKIDIIQCGYTIPNGIVGLIIKKRWQLPYVIYTYGRELLIYIHSYWARKFLLFILKNADKIIVISEYTKEILLKLGIKDEMIVKITPGVDLERFDINIDSTKIISTHNLQNKKVLLTIGRLTERKGIDMVIQALPDIIDKVPNVSYLIAGKGPDKERLEKIVKDRNLTDKVIFVGYVSDEDLPMYYKACDLFIMPSREIKEQGDVEGFGIVYIEANAEGKPVIGGHGGGVDDAIIDGVTGLLVDPLNIKEISEAVIKLFTDEKFAQELASRGYERVKEDFSATIKARQIQQILTNTLKICPQ